MRFYPLYAALVVSAFGLSGATAASARQWKDSTGNYSVEADLLATGDTQVVLKRQDGKLVVVEKTKLSAADQTFVADHEAAVPAASSEAGLQTWTMQSGLKVTGRVVGYGRKEITIIRKRGKVYVNDRVFENLPTVYQKMLPKIVSHFEGKQIDDETKLVGWAASQQGQPRTFQLEGVMLELENGDEYGVPFFFFSEEDRQVLEPGWQRWLAAHQEEERRRNEDFLVAAQAQAYQQDRANNQQIAQMQLLLQAVEAGVVDLWEVYLQPGRGVAAQPQFVVVPARDSRQAVQTALAKNPGFVAGPVRRVND
jgi:hypothetical protein